MRTLPEGELVRRLAIAASTDSRAAQARQVGMTRSAWQMWLSEQRRRGTVHERRATGGRVRGDRHQPARADAPGPKAHVEPRSQGSPRAPEAAVLAAAVAILRSEHRAMGPDDLASALAKIGVDINHRALEHMLRAESTRVGVVYEVEAGRFTATCPACGREF